MWTWKLCVTGCTKKIQQPVIRSRPGLTGEVTRMTEDYFAPFTDIAVPSDRESSLSSEERRLQSLRNLAMSRIVKARKYKRKQSQAAQRKMTEAERIAREHARILEEREMRRARTEENRRMAEAGIQKMLEEANPENALLLKSAFQIRTAAKTRISRLMSRRSLNRKKNRRRLPETKRKRRQRNKTNLKHPALPKANVIPAAFPHRIRTGSRQAVRSHSVF